MDDKTITYHFRQPDHTVSYTHSLEQKEPIDVSDAEDWTKLSFHRCSACSCDQQQYCHIAVRLQKPARLLNEFVSHQPLEVEVIAPERTYFKKTNAQEGLSSLFGLVMATSGNPAFDHLRGLARFHLPFASLEETMFRSASAYIMREFIRDGDMPDKQAIQDGLRAKYDVIAEVNRCAIYRLRQGIVPQFDAQQNAIIILDSLGAMVSLSLENRLKMLSEILE